ncbi:MAG TPA: hypothetical protein ENN79_03460 [Desulfobacteraceae bacterium]|nr:hypothetical protein [Desulfobacteraceae bacterium]
MQQGIEGTPLTGSNIPVRKKLDMILNFLDQGTLYAMGAEKQSALRTRAAELIAELDRMEHTFLTVGLLGGTGAGKSTIINALAAEKISSTSHRRPHTDRVIIYRHELSPPIDFSTAEIPFDEIIHSRDSIRHILLCDLPDFDSIEEHHRAVVKTLLPELDIVVWITTPEKYADARFYRFIDEASRSRDNFLFVLNKVDVLFQDVEAAEGYGRLSKVAAGLTENLSDQGISGAALYVISALEAMKGEFSPWNQFTAFRNLLFKHRDAKTVAAIKTSNIEMETSALKESLKGEVLVVDACVRAVRKIVRELKSGSPPVCAPPGVLVPPTLDSELHRRLTTGNRGDKALTGPGYLVWLAAGYLKRTLGRAEQKPPLPDPEEMLTAFRTCLEWSRNRLLREMMKENIPERLRERVTEILVEEERIERLRIRAAEVAEITLESVQRPGYGLFRLRQRTCYGLITILLLIVLGGEAGWLRLISEPGMTSIFELILAFINTVFSAEGLAALASYALINIFLGFRFFRRYQKFLNRRAEDLVKALSKQFRSAWHTTIEETAGDLEQEADRLVQQITAASAEIQPKQK